MKNEGLSAQGLGLKIILFSLSICPLSLSPSFSGSPGSTSASFLSIGAGPRLIAMGEIGAALGGDPYAAYWNPAGLAAVRSAQISLMHNAYFQDIHQQYAAYAHPAGSGAIGLSLTRLAVRPFAGFNAVGASIGSVEAQDWALGVSFAQAVGAGWELGAGPKFIRQSLGPVDAFSWAVDLGLRYRLSSDSLWLSKTCFGFSATNFGKGLRFDRERAPLPQTLRFGISYEDMWHSRPLAFSLEGRFPNDYSASVGAGAEYWLHKNIGIRAGMRSSQDAGSGLRLGFGFRAANLILDYAWSGFGALGAAHRMGLTWTFGASGYEKTAQAEETPPTVPMTIASWQESPAVFETASEKMLFKPASVSRLKKEAKRLVKQKLEPQHTPQANSVPKSRLITPLKSSGRAAVRALALRPVMLTDWLQQGYRWLAPPAFLSLLVKQLGLTAAQSFFIDYK